MKVWSSTNYEIGNWHVNGDEVCVLCLSSGHMFRLISSNQCVIRVTCTQNIRLFATPAVVSHFETATRDYPFNVNTLSNSNVAPWWWSALVNRPSSNINGLIWTHLKSLMLATTCVIIRAADWLRFILHKLVYNQHRDAMDKWFNCINWWFIDFE